MAETYNGRMATQSKPQLTPEEYLVRERLAGTKSEYFKGEVFAMVGASERHNRIVLNIGSEFHRQLRKGECSAYVSDMRLLVDETGLYTYPDVMVVCGELIFAQGQGDILTNPVVIVEVLSESTKDYDRGGKFHQYMKIPSLKEYLTVSQAEMLVDHSVRQTDGSWLIREIDAGSGKVVIGCLGVELEFGDIYEKVKFGG